MAAIPTFTGDGGPILGLTGEQRPCPFTLAISSHNTRSSSMHHRRDQCATFFPTKIFAIDFAATDEERREMLLEELKPINVAVLGAFFPFFGSMCQVC